ncbi:MAG: hypothetical protein A2W19_08990 [Spirochaetes bacterium RBG_16_49_21]|nr:MAG: hypothetical protein A2W19_08990 [Spirochaetes bacterium RBG_16_49_21]
MKILYKTASKKTEKPWRATRFEGAIFKQIESLLFVIESEKSKYERLSSSRSKKKTVSNNVHENLKKLQNENKILKSSIAFLQKQTEILQALLAGMRKNYRISDNISSGFFPDHDYNKYLSRFVDIDIQYSPSIGKLKEIGKHIKKFFLNDRRCTYIFIHCNGITEDLQNLLYINARKNQTGLADFLLDRSKVYQYNLEDLDLPERKLGRIIIGRYPYESGEKETTLNNRIETEILITKRLLEKYILEIQNKELAIKDGLTGLYSRKFFIERFTEEFNSMDMFSKLDESELNLLKIIIKSEGIAAHILRNHYFVKYKTKDEVLFNRVLNKLRSLNIISTKRIKYLGDLEDGYFFENSKMSYNLYLAILDLDRFKSVNDKWGGHSVGDKILREFANIIKKNIRTMDIPVRYGGEEFIIIFPRAMNYSRIFNVLEKIRHDCEHKLTVSWNGKKRNVTVSIGVTQLTKFDKNINYIVNRADAALYKAKKKRNRIVRCIQDNNDEFLYT